MGGCAFAVIDNYNKFLTRSNMRIFQVVPDHELADSSAIPGCKEDKVFAFHNNMIYIHTPFRISLCQRNSGYCFL